MLKCRDEWKNKIIKLRVIVEEVFKKILDVSDEPIASIADLTQKFRQSPGNQNPENPGATLQKKTWSEDSKINQPHAMAMSVEWFFKICKVIKENKEVIAEQFFLQSDGRKIPRVEKLENIIKKIDQVDNQLIKSELNSLGDPKFNYLYVYKSETSSRLYEKYFSRKKYTNYTQVVSLSRILLSSRLWPPSLPNSCKVSMSPP
jgi:hypothetical protein